MNFDPTTAQPDDAFDPNTATPDDGVTTRQVLHTAVQTNPDQAARAAKLAKEYQAPPDVLVRNLQNIELVDAVNKADQRLGSAPKLSELMRRSTFLAQQAHDDIEPLAGIEKVTAARADRTALGTVGDIGVTALKGAVGLPQAIVGLADILSAGYAGRAVENAGVRFADAQEFLDTLYSPAQQQANEAVREAQGFIDTLGAMLQNPSTIATTVGESAPQMLGGAAMGRALLTAAPKLAPWLAAAFGEGLMGAGATAEQIRSETEDGLLSAKQVFASTMSGAGTALFGAVGGRAAQRLGLGDIDTALVARGVDDATAKTLQRGFIARITGAGIAEGVFEELPQSMQEQLWQNFATDRPLGEGVGKAAAQGLLAGLSMGGGFQAVSEGAAAVERRLLERQGAAERAQAEGQRLSEAFQLAAQSKLRERNPETFQELVKQMAEETDGAPQSVFIDAQVLMQSATPEQIAQLLPSATEQIQEALATNGTIEVPLDEAMTYLPGTPLEQVFLQNARSAPDALSLADAQQAGTQAQEFLRTEAERVMAEAQDQQAWAASSEAVKTTLLGQLNATGRFTADVNDAYATLVRDFYSTLAARVGTTPEEMYARYPLRVTGVQPGQGAQVFNAGGKPGELTVEGYHYSRAARPVISTRFYGSGLRGSNRDLYLEAEDKRLRQRAYFYVDKGTGINPESGVGGIAQRAQLTNIYDSDADPLGLKRGANQLAFESAVLDAGFSGYLARMDGTQSGQVILLGDQAVQAEVLGPMGRIEAGQRVEALPRQEPQWKTQASGEPAQLQARLERMQSNPAWANYEMRIEGRELQVREKDGVLNQSVSTRLPTAKKALENPLEQMLIIGLEAAKADPKAFEKNVELIRQYPNFRDNKSASTPDKAAEQFIKHVIDNLLWLYDQVPADTRERSKLWYDGARAIVDRWVPKYNVTDAQAAGMLAVLSPQKDWFQNVSLAERVLDIMSTKQDFAWSEEMSQTAAGIGALNPEDVGEITGKTLGEIDSNYLQAMWVRVYDQTYNERGYRVVTPEGDFGDWVTNADGETRSKTAWGSFNEIGKAISIFKDGSIANISASLGEQHKVRNFYNNIFNPASEHGDVTIDTHAVAAGLLRPLSGSAVEVAHNFGAGGAASSSVFGSKGTYGIYAEAYRRAAEQRGVLPREMQSITWEAVRGLYTAGFKAQASNVAKIDAVWEQYKKRRISLDEARTQLLDLSGGIAPPEWERPGAGAPETPWASSYTGELRAGGGVDRAAGPGAGGVLAQSELGGLTDGRPEQAGDRGGRYSSGGLAPLEGAPDVRGAAGPDPRLVAVAEQYARDNGIELRRQAEYVKVDEARAARIAQAYAEMQHAPNDPKVKEAYADLIRQTRAQYDALVAAGYQFTFFDDATDPYQGNPWNAMRDLRANQRMAVYGTYAGFGVGADLNIGLADPNGGADLDPAAVLAAIKDIGGDVVGSVIHTSATEPTLVIKLKNQLDEQAAYRLSEALGQEAIAQSFEDGTGRLYGPQAANWGEYNPEFFVTADGRRASETLNPLLADTGLQWPDQNGVMRPVKANDLFRAVHDAFGHGLEGAGFRAQGEENAWQAHIRLFTGAAKGAITSETRGQNSWLNYGPYGEKNRTAKVEDTVFAEQKTGLMPEWTWSEGLAPDMQEVLEQGPRGTFNPRELLVTLNENADLSTFLHESGHFFLEVMADLASQPDAPAQVREDMGKVLAWFGVKAEEGSAFRGVKGNWDETQRQDIEWWAPSRKDAEVYAGENGTVVSARVALQNPLEIDEQSYTAEALNAAYSRGDVDGVVVTRDGEPIIIASFNRPAVARTPLEVWNAMTLDQKRPYHERWAESFEQYLFEGKAPSAELQPLFRRFRSWLVNVYKSLTEFMRGRDLKVSDDIRKVFDRMIATDEAIAQAEEAAGMLPDFDATNEAIEKLQARSLRDLKWTVNARNKTIKQLQKQAAELRKGIEAEVRAEVEQQPVYAAMRWLKKGETTDAATGDLVKAEKGFRLSTAALAEMYPETMLARPDLAGLRGMTAKEGLHPDMVADMFGFESGDALVRAILDAEPIASVVEGMADQRMLERHGDLVDQRAIEEAANEAVHNEARARSLATELKSQTEALNPRRQVGTASNGRAVTVNALTAAAKEFAQNLAARRRLKELKSAAAQHRAAEARAGRRWQEATAAGQTQEAVQAKRDQLLNNYTAKALVEAQAEVKKTLEFFRKVTKGGNEKTVERGRDPDVVNAMRAILAAYDVAPRLEKAALEYMETVQRNDPAMFNALNPSVVAAMQNAKPLTELTLEELRGLNDELRAMWELAKRSRQMEVDGNLLDIEDAADQLVARMQEIGVPDTIPGERGAITDRQELGIKLQFAKAILSRVEQWAERLDGTFGGPFLRLVFQPVKDAADRYRADKVAYREKFTELLKNVAPALPRGAIAAPELGYTFGNARDSGAAELLHAILHTGNDSNKRKLLLGRGWASENADGTLDTSRWDAFIERMINEGKLQKVHYDFAQGVWDLLEEMKPLAQETHRKVFGRYFAEVTANSFTTPFGTYRGGYVPAQTDSRIVKDAKLRELAEGENESMAYAFPASPSGFTKSRVEYNKPLLLDLRALAQHMDKVLLFSHMQGAVTDVRRLLTQKNVSYALDRIDPAAYEGMLIPWLNRAARQVVETPVVGDRKLSRFLSAARSRAGMALMFANLSNTFQQVTGLSSAAVLVRPGLLLKAMGTFTRNPKEMHRTVAEASPYMRNRMLNEVAAMNDAVEQILVDPTLLERGQAWTQRHAYFMQAAVDNTMSPIVWTAAYNQAMEEGQGEREAIRFADGVVRKTQGTTLPEDVSRFETGPGYARLFTQFVSYFNMMANTNATAMKQIVDEMGVKKGAGKLLYVALAGLLVPIWVAEAIAQAFRGGPEDEDDDGYLDDWLAAVFGFGTVRGLVAQVPIVGQAAQLVVNRFNDNPADDKFSLSPAVSLIESSVSAPASVYNAVVEDGNKMKAARDVAAAATMITGLPIYGAARPLFYLTGVADDRVEPTSGLDFARGVVTGTPSAESRVP